MITGKKRLIKPTQYEDELLERRKVKEMKLTKLLCIMAAVLIALGLSSYALAFHDGGVAHCDGCHTMHNSLGGEPNAIGGGPGANLLKGQDPSSTCLDCHEGSGSYHVMSNDGSNFTPGGDFYWITALAGNWDVPHNDPSTTSNRGHNVNALDFGLGPDVTHTEAPGGTYDAGILGCQSCHDPHAQLDGGTGEGSPAVEGSGSYGADPATGTFGNFRILGDTGFDAGDNVEFINSAPVARAPSFFGGAGITERDDNHTDYGFGMSEWCRNCHPGIVGMHPAGDGAKLASADPSLVANYNNYVATGDFTGVFDSGGPFFRLVPIERSETSPPLLDPSSVTGADGQSNVMCLTCHRAHASAFKQIARWDLNTEFLVDSNEEAPADVRDIMYYEDDIATRFGEFQRSLCNKCHVQD